MKRTLLMNSSLLTNGSEGVVEVAHCAGFKEDQHPTNGRWVNMSHIVKKSLDQYNMKGACFIMPEQS